MKNVERIKRNKKIKKKYRKEKKKVYRDLQKMKILSFR